MRELALFAGAGGGILGGILSGWRTVCAVEIDPYCQRVLLARQRDGMLPRFPIWDDVRTFDGHPWRGGVDVISGGFPCQDISAAGKGAGIDGERSGLWSEFARIIGEVRPRFAFVENSPILTSRGLSRVLGDLAALGYDAEWGVLGAHHAGAPHRRDRIWIVADANLDAGKQGRTGNAEEIAGRRNADRGSIEQDNLADAEPTGLQGSAGHRMSGAGRAPVKPASGSAEVPDAERVRELQPQGREPDQRGRPGDSCGEIHDPMRGRHGTQEGQVCSGGGRTELPGWWATEPRLGRVANGVAHRVDRLKAIGNGQVPLVAALAWDLLMERLDQ